MSRKNLFFIPKFLTFRSIDKPTPSWRTMVRLAVVVRSTVDIKCVKISQMLAQIIEQEQDCVCSPGLITASNWSLLIYLKGGKSHERNG